ncbi:DUF2259 domain-containing protein [Devosia sp.]|uniref:DUF2259 domain-containing protein n=1 Tax=Devosia sp. TaxID=1871048 RepID=UPI003A8E7FE3
MARLAASAAILLGLLAPAAAGDAATFAPIGFSGDGRYFAFEEFGIQDGSGFSFANIYLVDVAQDRWVGGSPWRVMRQTDGGPVALARDAAHQKAEAALAEFDVTAPATFTALNGDGEILPDNGATLTFGRPGFAMGGPTNLVTLSLTTTTPPPGNPDCLNYMDEPPVGFELRAMREDGSNSLLYADDTVPRSRGCAVGYKLYAVVGPTEWYWFDKTPIAIISVYSHGFEGPDRRFIAVPLPDLVE